MLPSSINCDTCSQSYDFPDPANGLYLYAPQYDVKNKTVKDEHLLSIPKQPVWCGTCNAPTFSEDLRSIRDWEHAIALTKMNKSIEYPINTTPLEDKTTAIEELKQLFNIRQKRHPKGHCLFCGGLQYIEFNNPNQQIRHDGCGGKFKFLYSVFSCIYRTSAYRIYSTDGKQIGRLQQHGETEGTFIVNECGYDSPNEKTE
ncbi:hypothetical protein [Pleionea sp. CnH1-48]|uniref:hypothetical protein n=1 Tax=Pleionea sp. CnH1-48 TaxID=2954494 RepID=UPI002097659A|nr:hypothetical protein [Pleionea sp. CnH1-48]MCO7223770.1 hypothetical protein [Pleionea sp. CnH1-48]